MRSTPWRSSPMVMADRYKSVASRLALAKNSRTAGLALSPLRSSLTTSVSRRYTSAAAFELLTTEVAVLANIRDRREHVGQVPPARSVQGGLQNFPVLLLGAAVAPGGPQFQGLDELVRELSHHQLGHDSLHRAVMIAMLSWPIYDCWRC